MGADSAGGLVYLVVVRWAIASLLAGILAASGCGYRLVRQRDRVFRVELEKLLERFFNSLLVVELRVQECLRSE